MSNEKNPWKKLLTKKVYSNPWIDVIEDRVINPSGGEGIYGKVIFKNFALGIIPIDDDGNTWLVGQYRYLLDEYSWEIPMGGGLKNLDIIESAKRELKEETGLQAEEWHEIMKIHTSNSVTNEVGFIFLAKGLTEGDTEFEDTEDLTIRKLPFKEAMEMVMNGEITDSISIAGLLKADKILY